MRRARTWMLAAAGCLALAGCGSETSAPGEALASLGQAARAKLGGGEDGAEVPVTRAVVAGFADPLLYARIPARGADALLGVAGRNGRDVTWRTPDGVALVLRDGGVLVATRGLGGDLMSAQVPDIRRPAADALRRHYYLGGNERMRREAFLCRIAAAGPATVTVLEKPYATRRMVESCRSKANEIKNEYWLSPGGEVRQSRQWIGPDIGYVTLQRVVN